MVVCELKVEGDSRRIEIFVRWDGYWMKQWGVLGYRVCVFWVVCRSVLVLRQFVCMFVCKFTSSHSSTNVSFLELEFRSVGLEVLDALLKHSGVKLELLTDVDILLMIEKGIRGGTSMISNRYGKANYKYMGKKYDPNQPSKYIPYLDANNLYGWAMMKPLPVGDFEWMKEDERKDWKNIPCILEVDLEYPKDLHDLHNDYPLAPERLKIGNVKKLIPNLGDKKNISFTLKI